MAQALTPRNSTEIGELAHELRTPLAAIVALAEVMREETLGPLNERYRGYVGGIHEGASHALGVLSDWLEGSSPPAERPSARGAVDVNALVTSCASVLEPLALRSGLRLTWHSAPLIPEIVADEGALRQVLFNLLANAFAFTPPGGSVTMTTASSSHGDVRIEIADTGDGMTEDELKWVRALPAAPSERPPGRSGRSGYGLPLVFRLTSANGGTVEIASALRRGTRVTLSFPPAAADAHVSV